MCVIRHPEERRRMSDNNDFCAQCATAMTIQRLFPTLVYCAPLQAGRWQPFNQRLLQECRRLRLDDESGRRWSARNYPGGYTSYSSASRMHRLSPTFAMLERKLARHVAAFVRALGFEMQGRELAMTDCWVNIMPRQVVHGLHLHPLSTISGTYYVRTPGGCAGLKLEDPRLDRFMAAPPRTAAAVRPWVEIPVAAGRLVLFESWLRHEVAPNPRATERISISFNYGWF
jgi:uncharacterized protein (TIGR02466 family)